MSNRLSSKGLQEELLLRKLRYHCNWYKTRTANVSGCGEFNTANPILQRLINKGLVKVSRTSSYRPNYVLKRRWTLLAPADGQVLKHLYCPCCKKHLNAAWPNSNWPISETTLEQAHAFDCQLRVDHYSDRSFEGARHAQIQLGKKGRTRKAGF